MGSYSQSALFFIFDTIYICNIYSKFEFYVTTDNTTIAGINYKEQR